MICQKCKTAQASVCVTQGIGAHKTDLYLCQKCANEDAAAKLKAAFGYMDSIPSHLLFGADHQLYMTQTGDERCPGCGITFAEIQKGGKMGCANCYSAFRAKLRPIITRIHRSAQHRGKNPNAAQGSPSANDASGQQPGLQSGQQPGLYPEQQPGLHPKQQPGQQTGQQPGTPGSVQPGYNQPAQPGQSPNYKHADGTDGAADAAGASYAAAGNMNATAKIVNAHNFSIEQLKAALVEAIHEEEYEKAAELRDLIKSLDN